MIHPNKYFDVNGKSLPVSMYCDHPDKSFNTCPTCLGRCEACPHGTASLTIEDFFKLYEAFNAAKRGV